MSQCLNLHVLVTGGAGFIGSHVTLGLLDADHDVTVVDNLSTGFRSAIPSGARFYQGDIGDRAFVAELIQRHKIDAIMHFAGSVVVSESVADPLKYYRNNTANSEALLDCAVANSVRHFIFSSTAAIYGVPEAVPVSEEAAPRPLNPYGASKLMVETMLRDVAGAHSLNVCALRYFNVAGADPAGRSGQSTAGATHLIKVAVETTVGRRRDIAIFGADYPTADGTGVRDYIHVTDLAEAHVLVLNKLAAEPGTCMTLNCGYGRGYSVLEVLDAVDRVAGTKIARRIEPRRVGDPPALVADNSRILATLGWRPRFNDLDAIVSHALAWERTLVQ
jgi:UDP-glucose 4-epimerase